MISVIVPVYNKEHYILNCIKSVINQTYKNIEILIIDDGSTDNSFEIIKNINDERIKYFTQENSGVSCARNKGIEISMGDYISFLDADDEWDIHFLEEMINKIENSNACYCGHVVKREKSVFEPYFEYKEGNILTEYIYNRCTPNTNSWLIKKDFIINNKIFFNSNKKWGEDMLFFINIILLCDEVKAVSKRLSIYNIDISNSLSENSINKINEDINWMNDAKKYIKMYGKSKKIIYHGIKAFDSYRIPAAIIYRIYQNRNIKSSKDLKKIMIANKQYLRKIRFTNGIRSIKLLVYYIKVYLFVNLKKGDNK